MDIQRTAVDRRGVTQMVVIHNDLLKRFKIYDPFPDPNQCTCSVSSSSHFLTWQHPSASQQEATQSRRTRWTSFSSYCSSHGWEQPQMVFFCFKIGLTCFFEEDSNAITQRPSCDLSGVWMKCLKSLSQFVSWSYKHDQKGLKRGINETELMTMWRDKNRNTNRWSRMMT